MKDSKLSKTLVITLLLSCLSGPAVVLAGAQSNFENNEVRVSFVDLNLESEEGVQTAYLRLQRASKQICGISSSTAILARSSLRSAGQRCYRRTLTRSVGKADNQNLARIHAQ